MENLKEWFDRVDSEKTGGITATQLKTALAVGNLEFPLSIVQQTIRMYDFDRNGTMNFQVNSIMRASFLRSSLGLQRNGRWIASGIAQ